MLLCAISWQTWSGRSILVSVQSMTCAPGHRHPPLQKHCLESDGVGMLSPLQTATTGARAAGPAAQPSESPEHHRHCYRCPPSVTSLVHARKHRPLHWPPHHCCHHCPLRPHRHYQSHLQVEPVEAMLVLAALPSLPPVRINSTNMDMYTSGMHARTSLQLCHFCSPLCPRA
jgi:hypothetical protein